MRREIHLARRASSAGIVRDRSANRGARLHSLARILRFIRSCHLLSAADRRATAPGKSRVIRHSRRVCKRGIFGIREKPTHRSAELVNPWRQLLHDTGDQLIRR